MWVQAQHLRVSASLNLAPWVPHFPYPCPGSEEVIYPPVTGATYALEHVCEHFLKVRSSSQTLVVALIKFSCLFLV